MKQLLLHLTIFLIFIITVYSSTDVPLRVPSFSEREEISTCSQTIYSKNLYNSLSTAEPPITNFSRLDMSKMVQERLVATKWLVAG